MRIRRVLFYLFLLFFHSAAVIAQSTSSTTKAATSSNRPKLVVGIVVDQMRWDYLYRYREMYSVGGFNRLMKKGFSCENTLITHLPTYTAVGHAGIYTGAFPSVHGIVGNNWFDKQTGQMMYCTEDSSVKTVGSSSAAGKMSPRNMLSGTIADELRLSNNFKNKVIGISLKDRGAILPAGHSGNAAYWYDESEGKWISSTYYMDILPQWVNAFNQKAYPDSFMSADWNTLLPIGKYTMSSADALPYEGFIPGEKTNSFPHALGSIKDEKYKAFRFTPFGNTFTINFARQAIINEQLGKSDATDFLALSLSSTDYIGHTFGPNSIEMQDTYVRLDRDLSGFIDFLDARLGKENYLLFLSADHGAAHIPAFLNEHKIPAGNINPKDLLKELNDSAASKFGVQKPVIKLENYQLYLDDQKTVSLSGEVKKNMVNYLVELLSKKEYISGVFKLREQGENALPDFIRSRIVNSFHHQRSGDIQLIYKPGYFDGGPTGTTHGTWNPYDAHIPLLWYGGAVPAGKTFREIHMTDIAATLAALLRIQMPNGSVGQPITELTDH